VFRHVSRNADALLGIGVASSFLENDFHSNAPPHQNISFAARNLYFYERTLQLRTTPLLLMHCQECEFVVIATGTLFQAGLITNMMKVVREFTTIIDEMLKMAADADLEAENLASDVARTGATSDDSDYNMKFLQVYNWFFVSNNVRQQWNVYSSLRTMS